VIYVLQKEYRNGNIVIILVTQSRDILEEIKEKYKNESIKGEVFHSSTYRLDKSYIR